MKRKRGHKKGKQKKQSVSLVSRNEQALNAVSINTDNSGLDDIDDAQMDSGMEVEASVSTRPDYLAKIENTDTEVLSDNPTGKLGHNGLTDRPTGQLGRGRVKVKLKSSKLYESQRTSSDAQTQSDTDKSSLQVGLGKQVEVTEKMEDSANSLPEMKVASLERSSQKAGSIKIKSSRGLGSSKVTVNPGSSQLRMQGERTTQTASDSEKPLDSSTSRESNQREPKHPYQNPRYNEEELSAALTVIKKVMKMDAAEPFNVPVNPVALGIPDYFDIIETPMDFGTICNNLERDVKYKNSEDVFKDVQYIWDNCYRYNNKGDYIVDLMKRVKKNFTKYWMAAGLYSDQSKRINGSNSSHVESLALCNQENLHLKGSHLKQKTRKRHGINRHKSDCLCAVCVVRRRRKEREGNSQVTENEIRISDSNLSQELKHEETSPMDNPCSEDASSNFDDSVEHDVDADLEEQGEEVKLETAEQYSPKQQEMYENEMDIEKNEVGESSKLRQGNGSGEEPNVHSQALEMEDPCVVVQLDTQKDGVSVQLNSEGKAVQHHDQDPTQPKQEDSQDRHRHTQIFDNLLRENPLVLELCTTLFPENSRSVWTGSHSLVRRRKSIHSGAIREAMKMLMK
ncbi:bromodomain testis-specific protein isoform X2 [Macadamia integrifolia]|uniref:bromodomain testis-specific protein isoform X2 n=1 Tax=Macadamia integrifolia TaxID=60698 RepID=UPI001C4F8C81|nr:bromodomain testis-specific protein isoform X2 [Macadamia integrifolia]